ncbi:MAG: hypothetical protein ACI86S_000965 [Paracoccaceae bacterium]|jgi:hypothetical protein
MASEDFVVACQRFASGAVGSLLASTALVVNWRDGIQQIVPPDPQGSGEAHLGGRNRSKASGHYQRFVNSIRSGCSPLVTGREANLELERMIQFETKGLGAIIILRGNRMCQIHLDCAKARPDAQRYPDRRSQMACIVHNIRAGNAARHIV